MHQSTANRPVSSTRPLSRVDRIVLTRAATGLKPAEKLLLRSLVDFMGNSTECWPSLSRLAAEVGVSVRHVRRLLRSLESSGWIRSEARFRPDRSQTSCVFKWAMAPDLHVRPPRTSVSALEINIGTIQENTLCRTAECDLNSEGKAPAAEQSAALELVPVEGPVLPVEASSIELPPEDASFDVPTSEAVSFETPSIPATQTRTPSPRFIVIDGSKFLDIREAERVYRAAVAAKLLNSGSVDRLAFFACWCAIAAKLKAGSVRHPERMMRFLLDNRKAMSAYPDHAAEVKARDAIRFLWPEKPYNPHG